MIFVEKYAFFTSNGKCFSFFSQNVGSTEYLQRHSTAVQYKGIYFLFASLGWFHGSCDTFTLTLTESFETFRACAIIISKTFLPLDKSYTTSHWRAVGQIPSTLRNDSLKHVLLCNLRSFALLCAIEILMTDSDSSSAGLSESILFRKFLDSSEDGESLETLSIAGYCRLKNSINRELSA